MAVARARIIRLFARWRAGDIHFFQIAANPKITEIHIHPLGDAVCEDFETDFGIRLSIGFTGGKKSEIWDS